MLPDLAGVAQRVRRAIATRRCNPPWPEVVFLDMPVEDGPADTVRATRRMVAAGVAAIVVLGGRRTKRLVASSCGDTPILGLSTGTNNVFPEMCEATIAGLAAGLVATGRIPKAEATMRNKVLRVEVDDVPVDLALVDVSVSSHRWVGSKALWHPETLDQIFVAFAEPDAIGLSSIAGLLRPVSRRAARGLRVDLAPPGKAAVTLNAPISPGLVVPVGVAGVRDIRPGKAQPVRIAQGVIALDGEREIEFTPGQWVTVRLDNHGPNTIDIDRVMARAGKERLLAS